MRFLALAKGVSLQQVEKTKGPSRFCTSARKLSLQRGKSGFSVSRFRAVAHNFYTAATDHYFFPIWLARCSGLLHHCSDQPLPFSATRFLLQRLASAFSLEFWLFVPRCNEDETRYSGQPLPFFQACWVPLFVAARVNLTTVASLCLSW